MDRLSKMGTMADNNASEYHRAVKPMPFLPVGINIAGKKILIVGAGRVALQKLRTLLLFGPQVTVVAPDICPEIETLGVICRRRSYGRDVLAGVFLVYACTSDRAVNRAIAQDAAAAGILCNVADDAQACAFISPAVAVVDDLVVAVDSQGRNPKLARQARDFLKERISEFLHGRD